jgi:hypothetical protein
VVPVIPSTVRSSPSRVARRSGSVSERSSTWIIVFMVASGVRSS